MIGAALRCTFQNTYFRFFSNYAFVSFVFFSCLKDIKPFLTVTWRQLQLQLELSKSAPTYQKFPAVYVSALEEADRWQLPQALGVTDAS